MPHLGTAVTYSPIPCVFNTACRSLEDKRYRIWLLLRSRGSSKLVRGSVASAGVVTYSRFHPSSPRRQWFTTWTRLSLAHESYHKMITECWTIHQYLGLISVYSLCWWATGPQKVLNTVPEWATSSSCDKEEGVKATAYVTFRNDLVGSPSQIKTTQHKKGWVPYVGTLAWLLYTCELFRLDHWILVPCWWYNGTYFEWF